MSEGIKLTEDEIHPPGRLLRVARKDSLLCLSIVRWDISLALNMTVLFLHVILNDSEGSHRVSEEYMF